MTANGILTKTLALFGFVDPVEMVDLKLFFTGFVLKSATASINQ